MCMCLHPSTVKGSFVLVWNFRGQINDVVLKTFLSPAKSLHSCFIMKQRVFLTSRFIWFTHWKRAKPQRNQLYVHLAFKNTGPSSTIIMHRVRCVLHHEPICFVPTEQGFYTKPGTVQYLYQVRHTYMEQGIWSRTPGYMEQGIRSRTTGYTDQGIQRKGTDSIQVQCHYLK